MLYILSFLIVVLFVNFLIATKLEESATATAKVKATKKLRKESAIVASNHTNRRAKREWENENSQLELPHYPNTFLLTKVY